MLDEGTNPIPADPPETQPPGGTTIESDGETTDISIAADVPETQPPKG